MAYNEALEQSGYAKLLADKNKVEEKKPETEELSEDEFMKIFSEDERVSP